MGLVFIPVELPTGDYYGGHRPGNGLFGESIVAVDLKTGARKWHYQLVHHGIWDWDIPCAPMLVDFTLNGRTVKAVAQPTKQSILYVFDRATGKPIWPIEEKPVPAGDVPGEKYSPTQPMPTKPPAYGRTGTSIDELIDFTPELRAEAIKVASRYKMGPIFTPPVVSKVEGPLGTLVFGCCQGGPDGRADRTIQRRTCCNVHVGQRDTAWFGASVSGPVGHELHLWAWRGRLRLRWLRARPVAEASVA